MTPFGLKLKNIRQKRGLSQQALAALLRIEPRVVSAAETGRGRPLPKALLDMLKAELCLPDIEAEELAEAAKVSEHTLRLPATATPIEIELMNRLVMAIETKTRVQRQTLCTSLAAII